MSQTKPISTKPPLRERLTKLIKRKPVAPVAVDALEFREITRDDPKEIKDLLIKKEAVHPFDGMIALPQLYNNRLAPNGRKEPIWDKHCFAMFASKESTPKNAVYVKLFYIEPDARGSIPSDKLPGNINDILQQPVAEVAHPNTAIFYSISTLAGGDKAAASSKKSDSKIVRGDKGHTPAEQLIREAAKHLKNTYGIQAFSTLSPVRSGTKEKADGFSQWLEARLTQAVSETNPSLLTPHEEGHLRAYTKATMDMSNHDALQVMLAEQSKLPPEEKRFLTDLMKDLTAYYVVHEKSENTKYLPRDKVTKFHIGNGAELANIHWLSDANCQLSDSIGGAGMMVNYRYYPDVIDIRKQHFKDRHTVRQSPALADRYAQRMAELGIVAPEAKTANASYPSIPSPKVQDVGLIERITVPMRKIS
jgi:hypothetical protein